VSGGELLAAGKREAPKESSLGASAAPFSFLSLLAAFCSSFVSAEMEARLLPVGWGELGALLCQ